MVPLPFDAANLTKIFYTQEEFLQLMHPTVNFSYLCSSFSLQYAVQSACGFFAVNENKPPANIFLPAAGGEK
jgi:hypothetical protein